MMYGTKFGGGYMPPQRRLLDETPMSADPSSAFVPAQRPVQRTSPMGGDIPPMASIGRMPTSGPMSGDQSGNWMRGGPVQRTPPMGGGGGGMPFNFGSPSMMMFLQYLNQMQRYRPQQPMGPQMGGMPQQPMQPQQAMGGMQSATPPPNPWRTFGSFGNMR